MNCHVTAQTRLLVTHSVAYLQQMDTIVVVKNGEISEMGTFQELLRHAASFSEFVLTYLNNPDSGDELDSESECVIGNIFRVIFFLETHVEMCLPMHVSRGNPSYGFFFVKPYKSLCSSKIYFNNGLMFDYFN